MKGDSIDKVLSLQKFTRQEKDAFVNILAYAKLSMVSSKDNLQQFINEQIDQVIKHEI